MACSRGVSPQVAFDHAYQTFLQGNLKQSQEEAGLEYQRLHDSDPEWAWRFRVLEAESLAWRGMYQQALTLLNSSPSRSTNKDLEIEVLALAGVAHARLHQFVDAEEKLAAATQICQAYSSATCGDVLRARGVLGIQRGQIDLAKRFFAQSLEFARIHHGRFLEATALLNLGLTSLREEHFDEAIDWTEAAYRAATSLGAGNISQTALGNLGWAYYNLGDTEKSLELSLDAEKRASHVGNVILQLSWITNAGYVYASRGDLALAKQSYLKALDLATMIKGREDIYNALRALAMVSVEAGDLEEARKYSNEALDMAHADHNRLNELYPLLVKGVVAAASHHALEAENIFREVKRDKKGNPSLKWRAEHGLARLYEDGKRTNDADREYRAALATLEAARSSLRRTDSKLPFSSNASRIYNDYLHFLVALGKTNDALRWADFSRARALADGLGVLPAKAAANAPPLNAPEIARGLHGTILFYWLGGKQSFVWVISPRNTRLFPLPPGPEIEAAVRRYRNALDSPQDVLTSADADGQWLYRTLVAPAQKMLPNGAPIFIVPDGSLNNLNFETLLVSEPVPHYWIDDVTIVNASSLRLLAASYSAANRYARLLLIGNSIPPNEKFPELPQAATQMQSVARHFPAARLRRFEREQANPQAYLSGTPEQFSYIHFVAHGTASRLSPLDSAIVLSKTGSEDDSFKLYARDIIRHPLQADLVTISACYGAGERSYAGEGLVGLSWAFQRAGAHNVIAALWDVADLSTEKLMSRLYDEMDRGVTVETALRIAKLSLLHSREFRNPFYWAPFQLYAQGRPRNRQSLRASR